MPKGLVFGAVFTLALYGAAHIANNLNLIAHRERIEMLREILRALDGRPPVYSI